MWKRLLKLWRLSEQPSEAAVRSTDWFSGGGVAMQCIIECKRDEARRWKDFATVNHINLKEAYYQGKQDALDELLNIVKLAAPTENSGLGCTPTDSIARKLV